MKVNKITIIVCTIVIVISGIVIFLLPNTESFTTIQNIVTGVFTSSIVSCIIVVVNYFHERNCIIEKIDNNLRNLYINMSVLSQIIGDVLPYIHRSTNLSNLAFKNISELSAYNVTFLNNMDLGLFVPFNKSEKINRICMLLSEFQQIAYNIRNISANLQVYVLEYDNKYMKLQSNIISGIPQNPQESTDIDNMKNLINIRTAKLHEYTVGKTQELEKIAKDFYNCKVSKQTWEEIKSSLMLQIEDIVRK